MRQLKHVLPLKMNTGQREQSTKRLGGILQTFEKQLSTLEIEPPREIRSYHFPLHNIGHELRDRRNADMPPPEEDQTNKKEHSDLE
ncbi:hypothetical protein M5D96_010773, partial [Drosophila gunungcola]